MAVGRIRVSVVLRQGAAYSYTLLLLAHILLSPCCQADLIRLPLRRAVGVEQSQEVKGRTRRVAEAVTQPMEGISGEGYYIDVSVGTPPQQLQILVDTGSSNFAIASAPNPHIQYFYNSSQSSTYSESGDSIYVPYTQGEWDGVIGKEVVSLSATDNATFTLPVAFIHHSTGFFIPQANWQGIVGMAYQAIARPDSLVPFWDSIQQQANLEDIFSMQLCGTAHSHNASAKPALEGNLVLGGVSEALYKGAILYSPIVKEMYYEVVITDVAVAGVSLSMQCKEYNYDRTIVDSGTTHLRLPTKVFDQLVTNIQAEISTSDLLVASPSPAFWTGSDLLCWDDLSLAFDLFPAVSISLLSAGSHHKFFTLHLTAQHYLRSVDASDYDFSFSTEPRTCLKFGISPSESGAVLGALLMESFYVIFDRQSRRIGFAETTCPPPAPGSKAQNPTIDGLHSAKANLSACQYVRAVHNDSNLLIVTYIMAAVCFLCALPLLIVLIQWQLRKVADRKQGRADSEAETVLTDRDSR